MVDIEQQIIAASSKGEKTYSFDERHNHSKPIDTWFQESQEGLILFSVFYTQACRWSKCLGCNLPSTSTLSHINYKDIVSQIDGLFSSPEVKDKAKDIKKFIISNNGSVLDQETFSSNALMHLMTQVNFNFPNLSVVSIETRPEYVDLSELEFLSRALKEGDTPTKLELAIGFEAFDEKVRNDVFQKGLSFKIFEEFVEKVAPYDFHLKCYFMQKPIPEMTDEQGVIDIHNAIDYLHDISNKHNVDINMHLNPTYVAKGTVLEKHFFEGSYKPPMLIDIATSALHCEKKNVSIFLGLYDEGLAVEGGSFIREGDGPLIERLENFNKTQNYDILKAVLENTIRKI